MGLETLCGTGMITSWLNTITHKGRAYSFFPLALWDGLWRDGMYDHLGLA